MNNNNMYEKYFEIIEDTFGRHFQNDDPIGSLTTLLNKPMTSRILYETSESMIQEISDLLTRNSKTITDEIESLEGIKSHYSGSIAPQNAEKFLCQTGLYVDTTIMSDPITYIQTFKEETDRNHFTDLLFRHSFNMLKVKKALINDSETPILHIIPKPLFIRSINDDFEEADENALDFFNELFTKHFDDLDQVNKFVSTIASKKELIETISDLSLLVPKISEEDVDTFLDGTLHICQSLDKLKSSTSAEALFSYIIGSLRENQIHSHFSTDFKLINSFDSSRAWHNYNWLLNNQSKRIDGRSLIINAVTLDEVKWFGDLSLEDVVKAREESCLQDFRETISKELYYTDEDKSLTDVAHQINYNLDVEFKKHSNNLNKLKNDYMFPYTKGYAGVVGGSISFVSGIINKDPLLTIGSGVVLGGSLLSWVHTIKNQYSSRNNLINSPLGVLFDVKGDVNE